MPDLPPVDRVVHNAGKAHMIPKSSKEEQAFFDVNVRGTENLLLALKPHPPKQFVFISSVAVYGVDQGESIDEGCPLHGKTPYAQSKIQAEALVQDFCAKYGIAYLILRLPLIVGPNPPGNLGAISKMIQSGHYIRIRNNHAQKSMVLGEDVAQFIQQWNGPSGIYNLTDGVHPRFSDLEQALARLHHQKLKWTLPQWPIQLAASFGSGLRKLGLPFPLTTDRLQKMTATLTFSDTKARQELGWRPRPVLSHLHELLR